ncbi:MAG: tRNA uridine-5-carboxymethylaminomethyl(34) synthesis GTPase MnmE [Myxococcales bacterium]|nr:tRNA uridine-5-carboxymethylaminomethyl(34) synthesis GTPase MnmE [Myxococcales bacterium]
MIENAYKPSSASDETIVAPATADQAAGVAIVRLSGPRAIAIGQQIAKRRQLPHARMCFGGLHSQTERIDQGYVVAFVGPKSFTGEDVVEIHSHGSPAVVRALCDAAVDFGARPARPGEFTRRAWLAGKLDLMQAEALMDLVSARSEAGRKQALAHLDGRASDALAGLRLPLIDAIADLEARLDFATQEDVDDLDRQAAVGRLQALAAQMARLSGSARAGQLRIHGARVALYGAPNAGKSTMFNALLGADRALVHDQPGTTRDVVEAQGVVEDLQVTWVDTAGVRDASGVVEAAGIERAHAAAAAADVVLWLTDSNQSEAAPLPALPLPPEGPVVVRLWTKADLLTSPSPATPAAISALRPGDVQQVLARVATALRDLQATRADDLVLTRARQATGLRAAAEATTRGAQALEIGEPLELPVADLRDAVDALDEVTGRIAPDEVLQAIFSRFCVGK